MSDKHEIDGGITWEITGIEALTQDPGNLRVHTEHNASLVSKSLNELGIVRPVAVDGDNQIIAGNQTVESAMQAGFTRVLIIDTPGDVLPVHRRSNLTESQRLMAAFLDNHAADTSYFNDELVGQAIFKYPDSFEGYLSKEERNAYLLAAGAAAGKAQLNPDEGGKMDQAAPLADAWGVAPGQIWEIPSLSVPGGSHWLLLGDSRDPAQVAELFAAAGNQPVRCLIFDPPYGVDYADKNEMLNRLDLNNERGHRSRLEVPIQGDKMTAAQVEDFIRTILQVWGTGCVSGATVYICGPSGDLLGSFLDAFDGSPFKFKQTLIWVKNNFVLGSQDYHYRHEHVLYGHMRKGTRYWCGSRSLDSVLEVDMPRSSKLHPTMKPPALMALLINNSSPAGDVIADPTAGSGSTAVAAETEGRLCYLGELCDPTPHPETGEITYGYGGVILQRMADLGLQPRLTRGARRIISDEGDTPA